MARRRGGAAGNPNNGLSAATSAKSPCQHRQYLRRPRARCRAGVLRIELAKGDVARARRIGTLATCVWRDGSDRRALPGRSGIAEPAVDPVRLLPVEGRLWRVLRGGGFEIRPHGR